MPLERKLFGSRVAWRMFGSFVVASLVPLLAFSWLATNRVGAALEREEFERLGNLSRNYGQITLDKLVSVAETLGELGALEGHARERANVTAVSVLIDGTERVASGDWPGSRATVHVASDKPTVTVLPSPTGADIVIGRRLGAATVFGRVAPEFLERSNGLLGSSAQVCLFQAAAPGSAPFYCSSPMPDPALRALASHSHSLDGEEQLRWLADGEDWLAADWQLFLPSRFNSGPWLVVVSEPRESALGALAGLQRVIPLAAVVTLALIVVLATSQIRRTLNPLDELLAGTKRIAAQDFKRPVQVNLRDEFGTLGDALNGMANRLDQQFTALRALAAIDRQILGSTELDPVLETLFARLDELIPGARHFALIVDPDEPEHGRLYNSHRGAIGMQRVVIGDELHRWLGRTSVESAATPAQLESLGFATDSGLSSCLFSVAPMAAAGALIAAKRDGSRLNRSEIGSLREFAARIAVALAASKREAELFRRAHYDSLTGLPNRELLHDRLHQAVAQAQREEHPLAVLFVDLDSFKAVNDTHGHPAGDDLLKETALRLSSVVRRADTVARLGGDEYAILLPHVHGPLEAEAVAVKASEALRHPFASANHQSFVSASIGIAMFPEDGGTAIELLRKADMAMYNAKDAGKGCYRFFAEDMDRRVQERHSLHSDLRGALAAGEISLAYHAQRMMNGGGYVAAEALLRWHHPQRGPVSPTVFVPILEETGLIGSVGAWALGRALADFAAWQRAGLPLERVAVNVSASQLLDPEFAGLVAEALRTTDLEGKNLEVELTEASLVTDFRTANDSLTRLRGLGVRIAVDDFGTGYSSLAYLNELVFDVLKIDRAFVVSLPAPKAVAIVKAVIAVADSLGKEVVAEGVETESQWSHLVALGCDFGQGYLFGKPLPRDEFAAFVVQNDIHAVTSVVRRPADLGNFR
ncbi:MAG TPA: EAL domain-containing protein [Gammaproteobacteria bacterium]